MYVYVSVPFFCFSFCNCFEQIRLKFSNGLVFSMLSRLGDKARFVLRQMWFGVDGMVAQVLFRIGRSSCADVTVTSAKREARERERERGWIYV